MAAGFAGCDSGTTDDGGGAGVINLPTAGSGNPGAGTGNPTAGGPGITAGAPGTGGATANAGAAPVAGGTSTAGAAGAGVLLKGIPLTPTDGWVDMASNTLGVQGAVFSFGDPTSKTGMVSDFLGDHACIKGTAALVDKTSTACSTMMFTPPATDCYGEYWGAAIGMNLNQPIDMTLVPPAGGAAVAFDASSIKGFAFEITGEGIPAPKDIRFKVESATTEFCNFPTIKLKKGANTVLFTDLVGACYKSPVPTEPLATTAQNALIKITWQVVTNTTTTVPFDFCIANIRALPK